MEVIIHVPQLAHVFQDPNILVQLSVFLACALPYKIHFTGLWS